MIPQRMRPSLDDSRLHRSLLALRSQLGLASAVAPPVVVGAMGGSGTRAFSQILQNAGVWMGARVDPATGDSLELRRCLKRHFEPACAASRSADPRGRLVDRRSFLRAFDRHRLGVGSRHARWGWKNPRNMWLIPFYARLFPELRFVHVVRDGRDMATSRNDFLQRKHGRFLLAPEEYADPASNQLRLWARGNLLAREDGERLLGPRYFWLRYESLCSDPTGSLTRLFRFLDLSPDPATLRDCASRVKASPGLGRWRNEAPLVLPAEVRAALDRFGYETSEETR